MSRSLNKHAKDRANDSRITTSDILCLTESQIEGSTLTNVVLKTLQLFSRHFNNSHDKLTPMGNN